MTYFSSSPEQTVTDAWIEDPYLRRWEVQADHEDREYEAELDDDEDLEGEGN